MTKNITANCCWTAAVDKLHIACACYIIIPFWYLRFKVFKIPVAKGNNNNHRASNTQAEKSP